MEKSPLIPEKTRYISHDSGQLTLQSMAMPNVGASQVLIKVSAFGVNRADLLQRAGKYPAPKGDSPVLGLEVAGTVVAVGDTAHHHLIGKRVLSLTAGGGYAEYAVAEQALLIPVPEKMPLYQAAGVAEVMLTAFDAIIRTGKLAPGQVLLCHGGASGVGAAAIRIAKAVGATVVTTQSSDEKGQFARSLGADHVINYKQQDFVTEMKALGLNANVILDPVGGKYLKGNLQVASLDCHCIMLAMLGGRFAELDFARLLQKRFNLHGSTLRNRTLEYKAELVKQFCQEFEEQLTEPHLEIPIYRQFNWQEIELAHQVLEHNENLGKVVVNVA